MAWIREWSWKLALLALPWQTRWFHDGLSLGGLPWEQGRWAFYLSWLPLVLAIYAACREPFKPAEHPLPPRAWVAIVGVFLLVLPVCFSIFPAASVQWLVQITLLALFAWAILHLRVDRESFLTLCVIAMIPQALLAISQFLGQQVFGSELLGMSSQLPASLGVSVIETTAGRILRAYGGMPHPNILGGWLAFALVASTRLKNKTWVLICASLFTAALMLTFSRSAWIAAALALVVSFAMRWRKAWTMDDKLSVMKLGAVILVTIGLVGFGVRDLLFVRTYGDTRLEQKSTNERMDAIRNTWNLVARHPVLGNGQNTAILALDRAGFGIAPPHFIFLLILFETGILGSIGFVLLVGRWIRAAGSDAILPLLLALPLGLFDHYLWSLWAGQCLIMLIALAPLTKRQK